MIALLLLLVTVAAVWAVYSRTPNVLQQWADDLLDAALSKFPDDPRLHKARASIRAVEVDAPEDMINYTRKTVRRGKFDRPRGVLYIGMVSPKGIPLPLEVVKGILVHEVAHAALDEGKHSLEWQDVYVRLLKVATADLKWNITLECSSCKFYGVCDSMQCPLCAWKACKKT